VLPGESARWAANVFAARRIVLSKVLRRPAQHLRQARTRINRLWPTEPIVPQQKILCHTLENGLVLLAEPMDSVESAAFCFLVPAGCIYESADRAGLATLTCEMLRRGCGPRDDRQFINDLDNLGVERAESVSDAHVSFIGATLAANMAPALEIYADLFRRPHLPEDKLQAARLLALQEARSVEDEPSQKLLQELRRRHFPEPYGRPPQGDEAGLLAIGMDDIRDCYQRLYRPNGTILGVAGRIDWDDLRRRVDSLFGSWECKRVDEIVPRSQPPRRTYHLPFDSNQTQIGIAYESVPYRHPDYFLASAGVGVLSNGMSARLFTEVREKRGLCYSVSASYYSTRDHGGVLCYAGSRAERAQETLDVTLAELERLAQGIEEHELARLKARVKSALIMQQESSAARAGAIVRDWHHLGRVRTLDELGAIIDGLTCTGINRYLADHPPRDFTIATLGPAPLAVGA
jgi:predicted Zn-dependent peptidase